MKKLSIYIRNAPFPASLTIVSFILFLLVNSFINLTSIEPYWMIGLIFALPFLIFSYITYLTAKKDLNKIPSNVITVIFIFTLGFLSLISIFIISIDAATTVIIILPITLLSRRISEKLTQTKKVQRIRIVFDETHEKHLFDNLASQGVIVRKSYLLNKFLHEDKHLKESALYFSLPKSRKLQDVMNQVSMQEYVFEIQEA